MSATTPSLEGVKRCTRCGEEKPLDQFYKNKRLAQGRDNFCIDCRKKANAEYYEANQERIKTNTKAYRLANPEWKKEYDRQYAEHNADNIREYQSAYRQQNLERLRVYALNRYLEVQPERLLAAAEYRAANRERINAWHREYARTAERKRQLKISAAIRRARKRQNGVVPFTDEQLRAKFLYWNDCCWICGDPATAIDHVKPLAAGGGHILCNMRPICGTCNSRKGSRWSLPSRAVILGFTE